MSSVFVISAPSGSGKSTLVGRLTKAVPGLRFSISHTTRAPRGAEREGEHYHFVPVEDFERMIEAGEFLEFATVFGNYYGTHGSELERARAAGVDLVLDIDVQGAAQLSKKLPDAITIFILPPSRQALEQRLRGRSEDPDSVIERRLGQAAREIRNYGAYDYVLVNDDLETSVKALASIVRAGRARRSLMEDQVMRILKSFE